MERIIFEQLKNELVSGIKKRGHPFRYFTLATVDVLNQPQSRTVVLREVNKDLELFFFTDKRSQKIIQLQTNAKVSALFYHPRKLVQVQLTGSAALVQEEDYINSFWSTVTEASKKDYTTSKAPGSTIQRPEEVTYLEENHHFSVIKIVPESIAYLRLKKPNHIRVKYTKVDAQWKHEFLVP